jgi:hypothetical protein
LAFVFLLKSEFLCTIPPCLKKKLQNQEEEEEVSVVDDRRENSRIHMMERESSRIQKKQVGEDDGKRELQDP